jgi:hypothetical protein
VILGENADARSRNHVRADSNAALSAEEGSRADGGAITNRDTDAELRHDTGADDGHAARQRNVPSERHSVTREGVHVNTVLEDESPPRTQLGCVLDDSPAPAKHGALHMPSEAEPEAP